MGFELYVSPTIYINISQVAVEICPVSRAAAGKLWPVLKIQLTLCFCQSRLIGAHSLVKCILCSGFGSTMAELSPHDRDHVVCTTSKIPACLFTEKSAEPCSRASVSLWLSQGEQKVANEGRRHLGFTGNHIFIRVLSQVLDLNFGLWTSYLTLDSSLSKVPATQNESGLTFS